MRSPVVVVAGGLRLHLLSPWLPQHRGLDPFWKRPYALPGGAPRSFEVDDWMSGERWAAALLFVALVLARMGLFFSGKGEECNGASICRHRRVV